MAMIITMMMLLFFDNSWIIIHLGRKPVSGGSPPRDSRAIIVVKVIIGVLFHRFDSVNTVVLVLRFRVVNMTMVNAK